MLYYLAELESTKISERTKAGLERARSEGKAIGRPDGYSRWASELARMKEESYSQGAMSRETGLSYNTDKKYLRRLERAGWYGALRRGQEA